MNFEVQNHVVIVKMSDVGVSNSKINQYVNILTGKF